MSVKVVGNKITMTRGDTLRVRVNPYTVTLDTDGNVVSRTPYTPTAGDSLRFAVKRVTMRNGKQYEDDAPLIRKKIPNDTQILQLDPKDTKNLDFDTYVYDAEITFADGTVYTFITTEDFILTPEVD